jgi:hypothetical protein
MTAPIRLCYISISCQTIEGLTCSKGRLVAVDAAAIYLGFTKLQKGMKRNMEESPREQYFWNIGQDAELDMQ